MTSHGIETMAGWSDWVPLITAQAPRLPGVYLARTDASGPLVYVGMAGERRGKRLRDRLRVCTSGKGLASGLGEAGWAGRHWWRRRLQGRAWTTSVA
ncbi:hypothetical protein ACWD4J_42575 [Streptomyces sp. NPDC002577]